MGSEMCIRDRIKSNKKEEMAEQPFLQAEDVFAGYADDAIIEL